MSVRNDKKDYPHPDDATVHAIHDLYVQEIVEGFGLCPFARRCREEDKLKRIIFWPEQTQVCSQEVAQKLNDVQSLQPVPDVVLLTFVVSEEHSWNKPDSFEIFLRELRETHAQVRKTTGGIAYYMVAFHPYLPLSSEPLRQETLIPMLRRSPDPVIQCVRAELLDAIRKQSQTSKLARLHVKLGNENYHWPNQTFAIANGANSLSAEIARNNFTHVGGGEGRKQLETRLQHIMQTKKRSYQNKNRKIAKSADI